jgi:2-polyprenyl-3-methyl-5-hydroxy-6-metoxy-1,4-benzoquinol methylase
MASILDTAKKIAQISRSGKLQRYRGKDLNDLELIVQEYYRSDQSKAYYTRLGAKKPWKDMVRRKSFLQYCEQATNILDFGCGAGSLALSLSNQFVEKKHLCQ